MFPLYLHYLLIDFRQTFVTGASWDADDLITFLGQNVKVQGHTIAAEAHSTRRYRRVQLFLVCSYYMFHISLHKQINLLLLLLLRFPVGPLSSYLGQLSLPSLWVGKRLSAWLAGVKAAAFARVGWQYNTVRSHMASVDR